MEYVCIAFSALSCILCAFALVILLKIAKKEAGLSEADLKKIRESVNESVNALSQSVANLVAERNKAMLDVINLKVEELSKKTDSLTEELRKEEAGIREFGSKYTADSLKQKEALLDKLKEELASFNAAVKEKLDDFRKDTKESIMNLSNTVEKNMGAIRQDNNEKLEQISKSVNEKLEHTLEEKLKDSFKSVVEGIGHVNEAVGEIKGLATDVGSLKSVLTNVKTKGIMGEVILGNIIREFLTAGQYEENVVTKKGSTERVEFAVKLPGSKDEAIYLPIDSKFPYESYSVITTSSDPDEIKNARALLRSNLLKYAKDVSEKYIDVPNTTDFAVIFLPLEGLYLEALNMGLFEEIQKTYKVNLTGPTTLTAFINSLNMGFRSLMIQKKSSDVFRILGAVKTEFSKFTDALEKTQQRVNQAADDLEKLVGTRTRKMNSALKGIEALPSDEASYLMDSETE